MNFYGVTTIMLMASDDGASSPVGIRDRSSRKVNQIGNTDRIRDRNCSRTLSMNAYTISNTTLRQQYCNVISLSALKL